MGDFYTLSRGLIRGGKQHGRRESVNTVETKLIWKTVQFNLMCGFTVLILFFGGGVGVEIEVSILESKY